MRWEHFFVLNLHRTIGKSIISIAGQATRFKISQRRSVTGVSIAMTKIFSFEHSKYFHWTTEEMQHLSPAKSSTAHKHTNFNFPLHQPPTYIAIAIAAVEASAGTLDKWRIVSERTLRWLRLCGGLICREGRKNESFWVLRNFLSSLGGS